MKPCQKLWGIFNTFFLQTSVDRKLISLKNLVLAGDGTPVYTSSKERKTVPANVWKMESGIANATASTTSRTAIPDGIPTTNVFTLDMTYTCLLHPIP